MSRLLKDVDWDNLNIEEVVLANSYRDLHVKGLDYLCLHRDPQLTLKAYFFEDGIQDVSEVVNPHNHRYDFWTECITGIVRNKWYVEGAVATRPAKRYSTFNWHTPLNGGNGFEYVGETRLSRTSQYTAAAGERYFMHYDELHTIQILKPKTCIVLAQYADRVPLDIPTRTWCGALEAPPLNGLYNRFTADQAMKRINLLKELSEPEPTKRNLVRNRHR